MLGGKHVNMLRRPHEGVGERSVR